MSITVLKNTLKTEKRHFQKGSYGTNFAEVHIIEDGIEKSLDVYFNPHDRVYGLEVYQGPNYIINASKKERSYSRHYLKFKDMPEKYHKIAYALYTRVPKRR